MRKAEATGHEIDTLVVPKKDEIGHKFIMVAPAKKREYAEQKRAKDHTK